MKKNNHRNEEKQKEKAKLEREKVSVVASVIGAFATLVIATAGIDAIDSIITISSEIKISDNATLLLNFVSSTSSDTTLVQQDISEMTIQDILRFK